MIITKTNIDSPETLEWFIHFQSLLKLLITQSHSIFGGIVRDYLVPCSLLFQNKYKFQTIKKIIEKYDSILINDFDVQVKSFEQANSIIKNIRNLSNVKKITRKNNIEYNDYPQYIISTEIVFTCCIGNDIKFMIDFVKVSDITSVDFNVNNLQWFNNSGFKLIQKSKEFYKLVYNNINELSHIEFNDIDWNDPIFEKACINFICNQILEKKAYFIKNRLNNTCEKIKERFKKLWIHGFKFYEFKYGNINCFITDSDFHHDDPCAICIDKIENNFIVIKTPCNHIFHLECIDRWSKQKPSCPVCRHQLKY
jgi:hypothetical protein